MYIGLTLFIFFNYPIQWRKNRMFIAVLIIWHVIGLSAVVMVFTVFRYIPYDGIRYEITRLGSMYYVVTTLQAILFFIRSISARTYMFIARRTDRAVSEQERRWLTDKRVHAILITAVSFLIFTVGYFNIDFLRSTEYDVSINANSAEKGLNICLIADIHAGSGTWEYTYDSMAKLIDSADADVLLIGGDVFDETTGEADVEDFIRVLEDIRRPKYGIYFVYGNHDSIVDDWTAKELSRVGVVTLKDEMTVIGEDIQLIGRMDPKYGAEGTDALFDQCSPDPDKPIIVLTHRPRGFQGMADRGCDLVMTGHTHGFNIPQFLGSNILEDMYYGIRRYDNMTAVVTSGVSAWGFHYKWPAVSEIVTIHVTFDGDVQSLAE